MRKQHVQFQLSIIHANCCPKFLRQFEGLTSVDTTPIWDQINDQQEGIETSVILARWWGGQVDEIERMSLWLTCSNGEEDICGCGCGCG